LAPGPDDRDLHDGLYPRPPGMDTGTYATLTGASESRSDSSTEVTDHPAEHEHQHHHWDLARVSRARL